MSEPIRGSDAAFVLDHQDAGFPPGMGDMFTPDPGEEDVSSFQRHDLLGAVFAVMHVNHAIEHGEHFLTFVDVPDIGLIGPVQARCDPGHIRHVDRTPCFGRGKCLAADDLHGRRSLMQ